jgi:hypothetical protein
MLVTVMLVLAVAPAEAKGRRRTEARRHLVVANKQYTKGAYREALVRYQKAYALVRKTDILVAIGKCQSKLEAWDDAVATFELYLRKTPRKQRRKDASRLLAVAQQQRSKPAVEEPAVTDAPAPVVAAAVEPADAPAIDVTAHAPAEDDETAIGVAAGTLYNFAVGGGRTFYGYAGVTLEIPRGRYTWSPELLIEASPDAGVWGLVTGLTLDIAINDWLGVDVTVEVGHDQEGADFENAVFFVGVAAGPAFFFDRWTLTPFVGVLRGINYDGYDVPVGINLTVGL